MAKESEYGRAKLLKENKEHERLLKSLSKYPPPHITKSKSKKTNNKKKKATKKTTKVVKKVQISTNINEIPTTEKKINKGKDESDNLVNQSEKTSNDEKKLNEQDSKKKIVKSHRRSTSEYSYTSCCNNNTNKNNSHSRAYSSCNEYNTNYNSNNTHLLINGNSTNIKCKNKYPDYKKSNEKIDKLYEIPLKPEIPIILESLIDKNNNEDDEDIETTRKRILAEIELIQNRPSLKKNQLNM